MIKIATIMSLKRLRCNGFLQDLELVSAKDRLSPDIFSPNLAVISLVDELL